MRLLINHQLILILIQSKRISYLLLKISKYRRNFTVLSSFFDVKKQRPKTNLEKCYQGSVNIEIYLDLKVYFSLVTCKINNLIALRSTNQITEISAPWWLNQEHISLNCLIAKDVKFDLLRCQVFNRDRCVKFLLLDISKTSVRKNHIVIW